MFNWSEVHLEQKYYLWNRDFSRTIIKLLHKIMCILPILILQGPPTHIDAFQKNIFSWHCNPKSIIFRIVRWGDLICNIIFSLHQPHIASTTSQRKDIKIFKGCGRGAPMGMPCPCPSGSNKNLEKKDGQRQLLYYLSLIRACNKVGIHRQKVCIP